MPRRLPSSGAPQDPREFHRSRLCHYEERRSALPQSMVEEGSGAPFPCGASPTSRDRQAASYLLSDYASYVTGEAFVIDGGSGSVVGLLGPAQADGAE